MAAIKDNGGRAIGCVTDVTDWKAVQNTAESVTKQLGPPTLLVNNAGSAAGLGRIDSVDPASWWQDLEVSLKGSFLCSRAVVAGMVARRKGRVINVASDVGIRPSPETSSYACSKAALLRLTDSLATETTEHGVTVFAISPGLLVRTVLTDQVLSTGPGQRWLSRMATPTWSKPEQAAQLVVRSRRARPTCFQAGICAFRTISTTWLAERRKSGKGTSTLCGSVDSRRGQARSSERRMEKKHGQDCLHHNLQSCSG